jgi:CPA2 family monovalent cation:H+ antiporter-2
MQDAHVLESIVIVLLTAVLIVPLFQRARLSAVLGYLAAGAIIGPYGLGVIESGPGTAVLAEFGVVFLLFTIGLELSVERLGAMRHHIFGLGSAQVLLSGAGIALVAWGWFGLSPEMAVVIGAALALSSTAVVLQVLSEQGDMLARVGRVGFSILLLQDIAVAPILALVPLLGMEGDGLALALGLAMVKAAAAVAVIVLIGRLLLRPVFRLAARTHNREVFAALALLVALGTGWATHHFGLSMALGAFLAGLMLAGTEYRHQVEADIEPYRGILLGFFFMTVGMMIDPQLVIDRLGLILALVAVILVFKGLVVWALCLAFRLSMPLAIRAGLLLAGCGEFAFVILGLGIDEGVVAREIGQLLVVVVAFSMILTPFLAGAGRGLQARMESRALQDGDALAAEAGGLRDHVVIAGFGRSGQTVARLLAERGIPHVALDLDTGRVTAARARGLHVFYGNAAQPDVMRRAEVQHARAVVVTIDQPRSAERVVHVLRHHYPDLHIVVRAHDTEHSRSLLEAGASSVVPEALEASLQLGHAVLRTAGTPDQEIDRIIGQLRAQDYAGLTDIVRKGGGSAAGTDEGRAGDAAESDDTSTDHPPADGGRRRGAG